jgi:regulatory protein
VRRASRRPVAAREPESEEAAFQEAVKRLARQPQSRAMLGERLRQAGFVDEAVRSALDRAEAAGYLDDREYAASLVRRRVASRGHGMIAQELRAKGLSPSAIGSALEQIDPDREYDKAATLGRSLLSGRRLADAEALLSYLAPKLARRGYGSGVVYRICRQLASEWEQARLFDGNLEPN